MLLHRVMESARWPLCALHYIAVILLVASSAQANEVYRPQTAQELADARSETAFRVRGARLAFINETALRRDFPELAGLTRPELEAWVLENFAYISENQLNLSGLRSTEIPVDLNDVKRAYRPERYNRAALVDAVSPERKQIGLVDVKGFGHGDKEAVLNQVKQFSAAAGDSHRIDALRIRDHSDGLMSFGEAIAELTRQTAAQMLFDIHNRASPLRFETVESYFIIELPFSILKNKDQSIRAALYGRQAHWGRDSGLEVPQKIYIDPFGHEQRSWMNAAVDFGGVLITDPRVAHNYSVPEGGDAANPQHSRAWAWGHDVARAFSNGDSDAVYRHLREMTAPLLEAWKAALSMPLQPQKRDYAVNFGEALVTLRNPTADTREKVRAAHYVLVETAVVPDSYSKQLLVMRLLTPEVLDAFYPKLHEEWRERLLTSLRVDLPIAKHYLRHALVDRQARIVRLAIEAASQTPELAREFRGVFEKLARSHPDRHARDLAKLRFAMTTSESLAVEEAIRLAVSPKVAATTRYRANEYLARHLDLPAVQEVLLKMASTEVIEEFPLNSLKDRADVDSVLRKVILRKRVSTAHETALKLLAPRLEHPENLAAVMKALKRRPLFRAFYYVGRAETIFREQAVNALAEVAPGNETALEFLKEVSRKDPDFYVRASAAFHYFTIKKTVDAFKVVKKNSKFMGDARLKEAYGLLARLQGCQTLLLP